MTVSVPGMPRCQLQRAFGPPPGQYVQCRLPDPHPESDHDFGVDWPVFGRNLDVAPQSWLAGTLRDTARRLQFYERRETELTQVAVELAAIAAGQTTVEHLSEATVRFLERSAPSILVMLTANRS
jgi:hypothetical protein